MYTHYFNKYEIVICNQKMALQSSWASWNHRDAVIKKNCYPFSSLLPHWKQSCSCKQWFYMYNIHIYFFSLWPKLTFPKVLFFIKIEHNTEGELDGSNQLLLKIGGISLLIASGSWLKPNIIYLGDTFLKYLRVIWVWVPTHVSCFWF